MDKRTVLAMALIALIVILWPFYMEWVSPPPKVSMPTRHLMDSSLVQRPIDTVRVEPILKKVVDKDTSHALSSIPEKWITVNTSLYTARISNKGGGTIHQWSLHKFKDSHGEYVDFVDEDRNLDLSFVFHNRKISVSSMNFHSSVTDSSVDLTTQKRFVVSYTLRLDSERSIVQTTIFYDNTYHVDRTVQFLGFGDDINGSEYYVEWVGGLEHTEADSMGEASYQKAYAMLGDEIQEFDIADKTSDEIGFTGITKWVATRTKYFAAYIIPKEKDGSGVKFLGTTKSENGRVVRKNHMVSLAMKFENGKVDSITVYIGPLDYGILNSYNENLGQILEWGWAIIKPLTKGILYTLNFLYAIIPNYGWVIVVFTFLVKIVLYPLTHKSYVGMQKMKEVMPRQKEIQRKFKGDSVKMQQEMMKLYKEIGYNPVSGCLPMLIQMPLLFPIYQVFNQTLDMRQAGFFGWISDLSRPDTVYVLHTGLPLIGDFHVNPLPIIMTIMTFVQQKIAPMTPMGDDSDPAQRFNQKFMMYGMPIMFFFLFNNFPSGLVLYWTIFNVLTVFQQYLMSKHLIK